MSTEVISIQKQDWTPEQIKLITDVVAKGATKDELQLFLYRCRNLGLDPLKPGQIYFIKYGTSPGTIVVGIEGFRAKAGRTGKLSGIKRGTLKDDQGKLIGAWAEVYRNDWQHCAREEVPLNEYNTGKGNWTRMPETMIKKVAEAAALRMAFPDDLGGIYTQEEMEQAEQSRPWMEQPPAGELQESTEWRFTFGKFKNYTVEQVYRDQGPEVLASYVDYLEYNAQKTGKPLSQTALDAIQNISSFLAAMEGAEVK